MAARSMQYEAKHEIDSLEGLSKKLTSDMRRHVRSLGQFPTFSPRWMEMADALHRVGAITEMEKNLPKEDKDATLWECEELALRYFLEDGKLNVCLRALVEAKEVQWQMLETKKDMNDEAADKMRKFEVGAGVTLRNAWDHVEALQTTDLPLLIEHITNVLLHSASAGSAMAVGDEDKLEDVQEVLVFHYIRSLSHRIDSIDEERVMALAAERHLVGVAAAALVARVSAMKDEDLLAAGEGLALLCESEDFAGCEEEMVGEYGEAVAELDVVLAPLTSEFAKRRRVRGILDLARKLKRRVGK